MGAIVYNRIVQLFDCILERRLYYTNRLQRIAFMVRKVWIVLLSMALLVGLMACGSGPEETPDTEAAGLTAAEPTAEAVEAPVEDTDRTDAEMRTFVIVPAESQAHYVVQEEFLAGALSKLGINAGNYVITGTTSVMEGELILNLETAAVSDESHILVDMTDLTTGESRRDEWIQDNGPTFSAYPTALFVPTGIENAPQNYQEGEETTFQLLGDLTVREVTQPATFDVIATLDGGTIRGTATADLLISDFGIEPPSFANTLTVADEFTIKIDLTAQEQ